MLHLTAHSFLLVNFLGNFVCGMQILEPMDSRLWDADSESMDCLDRLLGCGMQILNQWILGGHV
jgi:hypothetical protein